MASTTDDRLMITCGRCGQVYFRASEHTCMGGIHIIPEQEKPGLGDALVCSKCGTTTTWHINKLCHDCWEKAEAQWLEAHKQSFSEPNELTELLQEKTAFGARVAENASEDISVEARAALKQFSDAFSQPAVSEDTLSQALKAVKDRDKQYGSWKDVCGTTSEMYEAYRRARGEVTNSQDVIIFNILQKISRIAHGKNHPDNWIDIAGFASGGAEVSE